VKSLCWEQWTKGSDCHIGAEAERERQRDIQRKARIHKEREREAETEIVSFCLSSFEG